MDFFSVGDASKAAQCLAAHQLLEPDDETMQNNKKLYIEELNIPPDAFQVRPETQAYWQRQKNEKSLIEFIENKFVIDLVNSPSSKASVSFWSDEKLFSPQKHRNFFL